MPISLGVLATQFGCELIGDPEAVVTGVSSLPNATSESLSFLSNPAYLSDLPTTTAGAVILRQADVDACPVNSLVCDDPYATYARMAAVVCPQPVFPAGRHASAVVAESASVDESAHLGANVVIGERSIVGKSSVIGPGSVVGPNCVIGDNCRLVSNVTIVQDVRLGDRCIFHPGVVLGSDGFGNAMTADGWVKVPQLGGVTIGNDVEMGSNTTVDRGAIGDTVIGDGVRLDNMVMIGHNVRIGAHTAMVCMSGIAGSTIVGERCLFAGRSGAVGHINICDDVIVAAYSYVSKNVTKAGTYGASFPAEDARIWAKQVARFRRLGKLIDRVKKLEK
jgi:UDP-3-O-[3-hydroxymyristoyl] glucosamine N-acyltransferase